MQEVAKDNKTARYSRLFLHSLSVFCAVYDAQTLCDVLESITAGLISMIILSIWSVNRETCAAADAADRKQIVVGAAKLLTETSTVAQKPEVWGSLLKTIMAVVQQDTGATGPGGLTGAAGSDLADLEGTVLEAAEFDSTYSKLAYATLPDIDPCASIPSAGAFFAGKLKVFLQQPAGAQLSAVIGQALAPQEATALHAMLQQ